MFSNLPLDIAPVFSNLPLDMAPVFSNLPLDMAPVFSNLPLSSAPRHGNSGRRNKVPSVENAKMTNKSFLKLGVSHK